MMTEQELNNLIKGRATQPGIPSIVQEMMRLSQALEQQARDLAALYSTMSANGVSPVQD
jgi:hypothetical protein